MILQPSSMDVSANLKFGAIVCFYAMMAQEMNGTEACGQIFSDAASREKLLFFFA